MRRSITSERLYTNLCATISLAALPAIARDDSGSTTTVLSHQPVEIQHRATVTWPDGYSRKVDLTTTTTRPNYGGTRRWFVCPTCERRCTKLYAPEQRLPFACRKCWRLLYWSQFIKPEHPLALFYRDFEGRARPLTMSRSAVRQRETRFHRKVERLVMQGDVDGLSALIGGILPPETIAGMLQAMQAELADRGSPKAR